MTKLFTSDTTVFEHSMTKIITIIVSTAVMLTTILVNMFNINFYGLFSLHTFSSPEFKVWQIFTYMLGNKPNLMMLIDLIVFIVISYEVEKLIGSKNYLTYFCLQILILPICMLFFLYGESFRFATTDLVSSLYMLLYLKRYKKVNLFLLIFFGSFTFLAGVVTIISPTSTSADFGIYRFFGMLLAVGVAIFLEKKHKIIPHEAAK